LVVDLGYEGDQLRTATANPAALGVKEIVKWLNAREYRNRWEKTFGVGTIHRL
jgi:hypothetical protein